MGFPPATIQWPLSTRTLDILDPPWYSRCILEFRLQEDRK
jgi:hypothetical protein